MTYLIAYRLDFADGGAAEGQILQRGIESAEKAEELFKRLSQAMPAIAYSGDRSVTEAHMFWREEGEGERQR